MSLDRRARVWEVKVELIREKLVGEVGLIREVELIGERRRPGVRVGLVRIRLVGRHMFRIGAGHSIQCERTHNRHSETNCDHLFDEVSSADTLGTKFVVRHSAEL